MSTIIWPDYYAILGVPATASAQDIETAYNKVAQNTLTKVAAEKFKEIGEAYATLSDPTRRELYDISRVQHEESSTESVPVPETTIPINPDPATDQPASVPAKGAFHGRTVCCIRCNSTRVTLLAIGAIVVVGGYAVSTGNGKAMLITAFGLTSGAVCLFLGYAYWRRRQQMNNPV